ncbi:MAG: hypothetical protein D6689_05860 [Deltaproteobacteria bacterium]|nr:MAG: hypothetical protein D6689_05860 [Deltaproteobacteria bacterium]
MGCFDVVTNPAVAPDCTAATAHDPTVCPPCVMNTDCGGDDCRDFECVLCPGQSPDDLPDTCDTPDCPGGQTVCASNDDCSSTEYCNGGCCVAVVQ